jgi:hypothetical protein
VSGDALAPNASKLAEQTAPFTACLHGSGGGSGGGDCTRAGGCGSAAGADDSRDARGADCTSEHGGDRVGSARAEGGSVGSSKRRGVPPGSSSPTAPRLVRSRVLPAAPPRASPRQPQGSRPNGRAGGTGGRTSCGAGGHGPSLSSACGASSSGLPDVPLGPPPLCGPPHAPPPPPIATPPLTLPPVQAPHLHACQSGPSVGGNDDAHGSWESVRPPPKLTFRRALRDAVSAATETNELSRDSASATRGLCASSCCSRTSSACTGPARTHRSPRLPRPAHRVPSNWRQPGPCVPDWHGVHGFHLCSPSRAYSQARYSLGNRRPPPAGGTGAGRRGSSCSRAADGHSVGHPSRAAHLPCGHLFGADGDAQERLGRGADRERHAPRARRVSAGPASAVCHAASAVCRSASAVCQPASAVCWPASAVCRPAWAVCGAAASSRAARPRPRRHSKCAQVQAVRGNRLSWTMAEEQVHARLRCARAALHEGRGNAADACAINSWLV